MFAGELRKIGRRSMFVVSTGGAALILIMMVHVVANITMRYFFGQPLQGTQEVLQYWYMPIIAGIGFIVAKSKDEHLEAPIIFDMLSHANKRVILYFIYVLVVAVTLMIAYFGLLEAIHGTIIGKTAGASTIPSWPAQYIVPIVFTVLAIQYSTDLVGLWRRGSSPDEEPVDQLASLKGIE